MGPPFTNESSQLDFGETLAYDLGFLTQLFQGRNKEKDGQRSKQFDRTVAPRGERPSDSLGGAGGRQAGAWYFYNALGAWFRGLHRIHRRVFWMSLC